MSALEHYEKVQDQALEKINKKFKDKEIEKVDLVLLHYNNKVRQHFSKEVPN